MERGFDINKFLKPLCECPEQPYLSDKLQVADVLEWILKQVGKSCVWQTSYSISEEFLRRLYSIEKSDLVEEFNLVLDLRAMQKTLQLWEFLHRLNIKTFLAQNHSKVILIESLSGMCVSVITSQNLTRGNRMEDAIITTSKLVFDTLKASTLDLIRSHSVPFGDMYSKEVAAAREFFNSLDIKGMDNYSKEQLEEISKYAYTGMTISDIATLIGVDAQQLREDIQDKDSNVSKAYHHGKASIKFLINHNEIRMAEVGSPAAVEFIGKALLNMEDDE